MPVNLTVFEGVGEASFLGVCLPFTFVFATGELAMLEVDEEVELAFNLFSLTFNKAAQLVAVGLLAGLLGLVGLGVVSLVATVRLVVVVVIAVSVAATPLVDGSFTLSTLVGSFTIAAAAAASFTSCC